MQTLDYSLLSALSEYDTDVDTCTYRIKYLLAGGAVLPCSIAYRVDDTGSGKFVVTASHSLIDIPQDAVRIVADYVITHHDDQSDNEVRHIAASTAWIRLAKSITLCWLYTRDAQWGTLATNLVDRLTRIVDHTDALRSSKDSSICRATQSVAVTDRRCGNMSAILAIDADQIALLLRTIDPPPGISPWQWYARENGLLRRLVQPDEGSFAIPVSGSARYMIMGVLYQRGMVNNI